MVKRFLVFWCVSWKRTKTYHVEGCLIIKQINYGYRHLRKRDIKVKDLSERCTDLLGIRLTYKPSKLRRTHRGVRVTINLQPHEWLPLPPITATPFIYQFQRAVGQRKRLTLWVTPRPLPQQPTPNSLQKWCLPPPHPPSVSAHFLSLHATFISQHREVTGSTFPLHACGFVYFKKKGNCIKISWCSSPLHKIVDTRQYTKTCLA